MSRLLSASRGTSGGFDVMHVYNDEFTDPGTLSTKWAEHAGGYGTLHLDVDSTVSGALYIQGQIYQLIPPVPFRVESRVTYVDWDTGPGIGGIWVNLARAAPGPYFGFGVDCGSVGTLWLSGSEFDSSGAFVNNVPPGGVNPMAGYVYAVPHRTRLDVHSASNLDAYVSFDDGGSWTTITTAYNPGFTPTHVGLESGGARAGIDWIRFTRL